MGAGEALACTPVSLPWALAPITDYCLLPYGLLINGKQKARARDRPGVCGVARRPCQQDRTYLSLWALCDVHRKPAKGPF